MSAKQGCAKLTVEWNAEAQAVALDFDPAELKTWDFVIAVLKMAIAKAEDSRKMAMMAEMQQMAQRQIAIPNGRMPGLKF